MTQIISARFDAIWKRVIEEFQRDPGSIHGPNHRRRGERNALKISASNGAIVDL
jgi:hypothetical protein